jgi:predicted metal-dependent HD superfamily phosphohydrolase
VPTHEHGTGQLERAIAAVRDFAHDGAWAESALFDVLKGADEPTIAAALDHLATRGERLSPATLLAAWFHDAVYTGTPESDELSSAHLATASLSELRVDAGLVSQVSEFIVATIPAREVPDPAAPLAHLLDADLSIFAAAPHRYEQYAVAVRAEYAHVPEADFAAGRSRILSSYLAQPANYRTGAAQLLWERRARQNVSAEVERLRG